MKAIRAEMSKFRMDDFSSQCVSPPASPTSKTGDRPIAALAHAVGEHEALAHDAASDHSEEFFQRLRKV